MSNPLLEVASVPFGAALDSASVAVILLHGRDQTPAYMIDLAKRIGLPDVAYTAIPAKDSTWYPGSFLLPEASNQPHFGFGLERIEREVAALEARDIARDRIAVMGFSQGACMACEFVSRHPGRWAGLFAFTGGLMGPDGTTWDLKGDLQRTPVLLSNGDADPWVPWKRVEETARVFTRMNGEVDVRHYPGRDHLVNDDEIAAARRVLSGQVEDQTGAAPETLRANA